MTLNEPRPSWVQRLPKRARIALVISAVLAITAGSAAALAFTSPGTPHVDAAATPEPAISLTVEPSPSLEPSPSIEPSLAPSVAPSKPAPAPTSAKPSPRTPLAIRSLSVTKANSGGQVVATIKATTAGSGSAKIRVIFFFNGASNVEKYVTITGSGTITTEVSTPNGCVPGYTGSVWIGAEANPSIQDSVDIC